MIQYWKCVRFLSYFGSFIDPLPSNNKPKACVFTLYLNFNFGNVYIKQWETNKYVEKSYARSSETAAKKNAEECVKINA